MDSPEVRLARLDEALKNAQNRLETMSEAYAPTNKQVIENALQISEIKSDITEIRTEITKQVERREGEIRALENQALAIKHEIDQLDRKWEQQRVAQENRERRRHEQAEKQARDERIARNRWIVGIAVSILLVVLSVWLGTVFG